MDSADAATPRILGGRYRVIERLGSGGMASVMLAEDERLGRLVALKRLPTSSPDDALARFRREARLGASLNHPNVVSIFDSTTDDDGLLIVMEYVDGESLKERLRQGPLTTDEATRVLSQVAAALDHAHASGVIHRDVKPSNVLLASDGIAKLADLGIATAIDATRITTADDIVGTLSYIAPERLEGADDEPAGDIYSLAAVAFESLSGERAQVGGTPSEIVNAGRPRDLREAWPGAPAAAAEVLRDGLARDPRRRPASARELIARLRAALDGKPAPGAERAAILAPAAAPPSSRRLRRRAAIAAAFSAAAGALLAVLLIGGGSGKDVKPIAKVKTRTETVTSSTAPRSPQPAPAPLSGAALGTELNDRGKALIDAGSYPAAITILVRAVHAFPQGTTDINYAYALFNLGHALRLAGRPQEAIPILEQRLRIPDQLSTVQSELTAAEQEAGLPSPTGGTGPGANEDASGGAGPPGPKPGKGPKGKDD